MQHSSSGEWVWPECILHIPICICHIEWRVFIFSTSDASQWGEIRQRGSAKMITFTSSSLLYLWRIQTDSRCERTKEDPWNTYTWNLCNKGRCFRKKNITANRSPLCYEKDFRETNKTSVHGNTSMSCERVCSVTDAWKCYLALISGKLSAPRWIRTTALSSCLAYHAALNSVRVCFLAWDVSTSNCQQLCHMFFLKGFEDLTDSWIL